MLDLRTLKLTEHGFRCTGVGDTSKEVLQEIDETIPLKVTKTAFNSRLQPTRIALGKVQSATDLLKIDYTYGTVVNGQLNTAKNSGNIQSQTITVPTVGSSTGFTAVQTYAYDALNRIDDERRLARCHRNHAIRPTKK